jgi:ketosteroid isomerase-like protein
MAYEIGTYEMAMDGPAGRIEDDGKYVVVWRKSDDGWKVAADIFNSSRPS